MAVNVPAARIPGQFRGTPHAGNPLNPRMAGHGGGGGSSGAHGGGDVGDYQDRPFVGGLLGALGLDESIAKQNTAGRQAERAKIDAGNREALDAYAANLQKTGNPKQALHDTIAGDGHAHFVKSWPLLYQFHQAMEATQQSGQPQVVSLKGANGAYDVLATPDGKYHPLTPHADKTTLHPVQQPDGTTKLVPFNNQGQPAGEGMQVKNAPEAKVKALTPQEQNQLEALNTIAFNTEKLRNTVGAAGSLGYGAAERAIAMHTPLSAPQAQAYNQAYNEIMAAATVVAGNPRLRDVAHAALEMLPKPGNANAFTVNQAIPALQLRVRDQLAATARTYHQEGKSTAEVDDLVKAHDAHPDYMSDIRAGRQALQHDPKSMTDSQVAPLMNELVEGRLPQDEALRIMRQGYQRGMIKPEDFDKAVAAHPELAQIGDNERLDNPRVWQPQPAAQQIPSGQPPQAPPPAPRAQAPAPPPQAQQIASPPQAPPPPAPPAPTPQGGAPVNVPPPPGAPIATPADIDPRDGAGL